MSFGIVYIYIYNMNIQYEYIICIYNLYINRITKPLKPNLFKKPTDKIIYFSHQLSYLTLASSDLASIDSFSLVVLSSGSAVLDLLCFGEENLAVLFNISDICLL